MTEICDPPVFFVDGEPMEILDVTADAGYDTLTTTRQVEANSIAPDTRRRLPRLCEPE